MTGTIEEVRAPATVVDLTTPALKSIQTWKDLAEVFQKVLSENIDEPIRELEYLRFLTEQTDVEVLQRTVRMLGFDVSQDILEFSGNKLLKVIPQLSLYPDNNGTIFFSKFFDFLVNASTSIIYLFTNDYVNFYPEPQGPLITEGGDWYATTHIDLVIALFITTEQLKNVNLSTNTTFVDRLLEVFYEYAPATLVVRDVTFDYRENITIGVAAQVVNSSLRYARV